MENQILTRGAEADIIRKGNKIIKDRIKKGYRIEKIDNALRKKRTKSEIKLLEKASKLINAPKPSTSKDIYKIEMPFIEGRRLSEKLNELKKEKQVRILNDIGKSISKLHENNIIHGDLTTSNMILRKDKTWLIDFGLGFISTKTEDKAVDIHLLKEGLKAKHYKKSKELFEEFKNSYEKEYSESKKVFERLKSIEKRGRYRH